MRLYGYPAYLLRVHLQGSFKDANLTANEQAFNLSMSAVKISVQWISGDIITLSSLI